MSRKVPFEKTEECVDEKIKINVIGPECQEKTLCGSNIPSLDTLSMPEEIAKGVKISAQAYSAERDKKGNIKRKLTRKQFKEKSEQEAEK